MRRWRDCAMSMDHSFFLFRGQFYKVTKMNYMGNSLSPFVADVFMAKFVCILTEEDEFRIALSI